MSIADVSKTMSELAAAINKKNHELQLLKAKYSHNLNVVQKYLELIKSSDIPQSPEEFLQLIQTPVECHQCGNKLYDISKDSDYVLIPRKPLPPTSSCPEGSDDVMSNVEATLGQLDLDKASGRKPVHHTRLPSKRTCSYCGKAGHSRSRCFSRLSKEPGCKK